MNAVRCILIDDHEEEHEIFSVSLKSTGLPVVCHYYLYADETFQYLYHRIGPEPKVIFIDVNIPRMNGFEFLQKMKATEHLKHIPIYVFSIGEMDESKSRALALGAAGYLVKPGSRLELSDMLVETLKLYMPKLEKR